MEGIQLSLLGKMYQEPSAATSETISDACWKRLRTSQGGEYQCLDLRAESGCEPVKSWATDTPSPGGYWTRNTGECPSVAKESTLWQILQADAPVKYYLTAKACAGILRRAERRGKALPPLLREALEEAVMLSD